MARAVNRRDDTDDLEQARAVPLSVLSGTPITIDGRTFHVGKVSLNQLAAIARLALVAMQHMSARQREELQRIAEATGRQTSAQSLGNVEALLALLEEDTLQRAVAIVLRCDDPEWVDQHVGPEDLMDVIDAMVEHNNLEKLVRGFLRLTERLRSLQGTTSAKPS